MGGNAILTGVELIGTSIGSIAEIKPDVVKMRYIDRVSEVLEHTKWILTRPPTEGYNANDIVNGFEYWRSALYERELLGKWYGHELGNEPNHPATERGSWGAGGYGGYEVELINALREIDPVYHPDLYLPGLVPYNGTAEWAAMYDRIQQRFPNLGGRAAHVYGQINANDGRVDDAIAQVSRKPHSIITEVGDSGHELNPPASVEQRVGNNSESMILAAAAGIFDAAILFHNNPDDGWADFAFDPKYQRMILNVAKVPPINIPPPSPKPKGDNIVAFDPNPFNKNVFKHPADGRDGAVLAYARANNAIILSDEWWGHSDFSTTETNRGAIYYSERTGVFAEVPFA